MASNNFTNQPIVVSAKQTIPASVGCTGTFITQGTGIVGTGTLFFTELPINSYVYDASSNEIRRVTRVDSNTTAWLTKAFTADLSSAQHQIISASKCTAKQYVFTAVTAVGQQVDNTGTLVDSFPVGVPIYISKLGNSRTSFRDLLKPVIIAPTGGGTIKVQVDY